MKVLAFTGEHIDSEVWLIDVSPDDLANALVIELRNHPHFSNVLTHVSGADWSRLEAAFACLLDLVGDVDVTPLFKNLLALVCSGSGTTGRMLKPWFEDWLRWACGTSEAEAMIDRLARLYAVAAETPRRRKKSAMRIFREHDERCAAAGLPLAEGGVLRLLP